MRLIALAASLAMAALTATAKEICTECQVAEGSYAAATPEGDGPFPVLVHLHGMGGTGPGVLRGASARVALDRGYAVIAPTGWQPVSRYPKNWGVADGRNYTRDDISFLRDVIEDAATRMNIDRGQAVNERLLTRRLDGLGRGMQGA